MRADPRGSKGSLNTAEGIPGNPCGHDGRRSTHGLGPADSDRLLAALAALASGGVVVYPTETLYGLGVDVADDRALARLAQLKGRDAGKPISLLVASFDMLSLVTDFPLPDAARRLADAFWPGPLTLVLPARAGLSPVVTGGGHTVGVRISSHPDAQALALGLSRPITSTSANPGGERPAVDVIAARAYFGARVDAYVDAGPSPGGLASTVLDCSVVPPRLVRPGAITISRLTDVVGEIADSSPES